MQNIERGEWKTREREVIGRKTRVSKVIGLFWQKLILLTFNSSMTDPLFRLRDIFLAFTVAILPMTSSSSKLIVTSSSSPVDLHLAGPKMTTFLGPMMLEDRTVWTATCSMIAHSCQAIDTAIVSKICRLIPILNQQIKSSSDENNINFLCYYQQLIRQMGNNYSKYII